MCAAPAAESTEAASRTLAPVVITSSTSTTRRPASEGAALVEGQVLAPLAIAAFVIGRELTIWFGAWVAARGRRVTELNTEALREYERTLEAGPRLHQG